MSLFKPNSRAETSSTRGSLKKYCHFPISQCAIAWFTGSKGIPSNSLNAFAPTKPTRRAGPIPGPCEKAMAFNSQSEIPASRKAFSIVFRNSFEWCSAKSLGTKPFFVCGTLARALALILIFPACDSTMPPPRVCAVLSMPRTKAISNTACRHQIKYGYDGHEVVEGVRGDARVNVFFPLHVK